MENFNKKIDRKMNDSRKWNGMKQYCDTNDLLPMWVADMDLEVPEFAIEALKKKADEKIFGYTMEKDEYFYSLINWVKRRRGIELDRNKIAHSPTVITSLNLIIKMLTKVGDGILIQTPSYPQFIKQIEKNGRKTLINELSEVNGEYSFNLEDFEEKLKESKLFILCNPHNPSGRVWTREELTTIADLCVKYKVKVISDEIHSDLILDGNHIGMASLNKEIEKITYTCLSATKTFNIAGVQSSFAVFPSVEEKLEFVEELGLIGMHEPNSFCMNMVISLYNNGDEWLEELLDHIRGNIDYAVEYIRKNIPKLKVSKPEATYLLWIDFRSLELSGEEIKEIMLTKGRVALTMGSAFKMEKYARMNVACPRYMLEDGLTRLKKAFR
ncbi:MAG: pyridoxal phosphate-dependent aminotransferase [Psychrilyobacter sp.]|nr:pyridoxal phosphate-dependent aminotransferase [Psychrilyobacter sp.]